MQFRGILGRKKQKAEILVCQKKFSFLIFMEVLSGTFSYEDCHEQFPLRRWAKEKTMFSKGNVLLHTSFVEYVVVKIKAVLHNSEYEPIRCAGNDFFFTAGHRCRNGIKTVEPTSFALSIA
ncbi:MAG: hypothetical protein V8Q36_04595 [Anaerotignum sp.]